MIKQANNNNFEIKNSKLTIKFKIINYEIIKFNFFLPR